MSETQIKKQAKSNFYAGFLGAWNSGSSTRSWENWIRIWRNTEGLFNSFARKSFTLEHPKVALKQILEKVQANGFTILLSSDDYLAIMKTANGAHNFNEEDVVPLAYAEFAVNDTTLQTSYEGDQDIVTWFTTELSAIFSSYGQTVHRLLGFGAQGAEIKQEFLFNKPEILSKDYYYPWLKEAGYESIAALAKEYNESTNNALLLIGPPGTGKSSLIRTLIILIGRENNSIVESEQAVTHPGFNSWLGSVKHGSMVALEDNDALVRSREGGNSVMATLLNVTQGIVQSDIKIAI